MQQLLIILAMALDTLPDIGRVLLFAILLASILCALARLLPHELGSAVNVMYRKGVLFALLAMPVVMYFAGIQMPVYMDEVRDFKTSVPHSITILVSVAWLVGAFYYLSRLVRQLRLTINSVRQGQSLEEVNTKLMGRIEHWQQRISLVRTITAHCHGAEFPWHAGTHILMPAAAVNWPRGVMDVVVLKQLAAIKSRSWYWLVFSEIVAAIYWPLPWVRHMAKTLAEHLAVSGVSLAEAAYRDPEGWLRDLRRYDKRAETLQKPPPKGDDPLLRLPVIAWRPVRAPDLPRRKVGESETSFEEKWKVSQKRRAAKRRDPYQQAYWFIAVTCLVVGLATTLTIVQTPPEFEPTFLKLKWQDEMSRRIRDYDDQQSGSDARSGRAQEERADER